MASTSGPPNRGQRGSGGGSGGTQLDFSQAMTDFKVMFPDMDAEVIEAVLRSNNGAVDATIDHLLTMSADNEMQKAAPRTPPEQIDLFSGPVASESSDPGPVSGTVPKAVKAKEVAAILKSGGSRSKVEPPSYSQATQRDPEPVEDLINLGVNADNAPPSFGASFLESQVPKTKDVLLPKPGPVESAVDLLGDLDLGSLGAMPKYCPKSPPRQHLAYSHPDRQAKEKEDAFSSSPPSYVHSTTHDQVPSGAGMVPTQQQLQEIYEVNLRQREEAKKGQDPGHQRAQFLEDERIALMLQNEEFMAELRRDHEFLSALELDDEPQERPRGPVSKAKTMDEAVFREKLKNMGKTSKRKFSQMASMFSRRKGAKQLLGHAPAPSKDNLLLNAEPLVNDESDEEQQQSKTPTKGKYSSLS